jgi:hypothetical protein
MPDAVQISMISIAVQISMIPDAVQISIIVQISMILGELKMYMSLKAKADSLGPVIPDAVQISITPLVPVIPATTVSSILHIVPIPIGYTIYGGVSDFIGYEGSRDYDGAPNLLCARLTSASRKRYRSSLFSKKAVRIDARPLKGDI